MAPIRSKTGRFQSKKQAACKERVSDQAKVLVAKAREKKVQLEEKQPIDDMGRRFVEPALLAKLMWCKTCDIPLSFRGIEKELQRGLASIFFIRCGQCLDVVKVSTSTVVKSADNSGYPLYSVNCCLDSGIGHDQLNNFLTVVNCPLIHHATMKRAEERVGHAYEDVAQQSCQSAILEEKRLTAASAQTGEPNPADTTMAQEEVGIVAEYDFGWDTHGSGFAYNSKSGRGSVIGHKTHKVLAYSVMSSACSMCARGHKPEDHDCRMNHSGSAKSMEPEAAVQLLAKNQDFTDAGVRVDVLVGDEDAATYCHVQQQAAHHVEKWIDTNHSTKKVSNKLYTAAKKHKFLSSTVIKYIKRCFTYAVAQNKDNVPGLKHDLNNIVSHTFGEHTECGSWCKAKNDPQYVFKNLPGGKPFSCPGWRSDFETIINCYVEKADTIAPGGSSQRNESFNHMVVTRAPKSRFYGSSPALSYRVAAAVLQKNNGATHILDANKKAGLSPGGVTAKYRQQIQARRKKKADRQLTVEYKRRRLFNKSKSRTGAAAQRQKEGFSYVSGMSTTMERAVAATCELNAWIPEPTPLHYNCVPVLVDTETTGLGADVEIIQLAARCGDKLFDAYMLPTKAISPRASEATGLTVVNGNLFYFGKVVSTTPSEDVARDFLSFLHSCGEQLVLVGHNLLRFDAPLILKWMQGHSLARALCSLLYGVTDTIPLLRQGKVQKQEALAKQYLVGPEWQKIHESAHNAASDCLILSGLIKHFKISEAVLKEKSVQISEFLERQAMLKNQKKNLPGLNCMKGVVSELMRSKMARHGITLEEIKNEYKLHGEKAVCLGVQVKGKPRVTTAKKIVAKVCEYLA